MASPDNSLQPDLFAPDANLPSAPPAKVQAKEAEREPMINPDKQALQAVRQMIGDKHGMPASLFGPTLDEVKALVSETIASGQRPSMELLVALTGLIEKTLPANGDPDARRKAARVQAATFCQEEAKFREQDMTFGTWEGKLGGPDR